MTITEAHAMLLPYLEAPYQRRSSFIEAQTASYSDLEPAKRHFGATYHVCLVPGLNAKKADQWVHKDGFADPVAQAIAAILEEAAMPPTQEQIMAAADAAVAGLEGQADGPVEHFA